MQLHMLDGLPDCLAAGDDVIISIARQQQRNGLGIDIGCEKEWPNLVVQIASDFGALFFLHRRELLVEPLVLLLSGSELCRHAIEGPIDQVEVLRPHFSNMGGVVALSNAGQSRRKRFEWPKRSPEYRVDERQYDAAE